MISSYYAAPIADFIRQSGAEVLGALSRSHTFALEQTQRNAWISQIDILKDQFSVSMDGMIYFECIIPRLGKRADCVVLLGNTVLVLEFKVGASSFDRQSIEQVHDYALDLKNFHLGTHDAWVIPVLVATKADYSRSSIQFESDQVADPILLNAKDLRSAVFEKIDSQLGRDINANDWENAGYMPTPTIIEAARILYETHSVSEISRSDAGAKNLRETNNEISRIIESARSNGQKAICFITGVPGAGKTLAGLNVATQQTSQAGEEHAVFLSGNGPLVTVLREALARDQMAREQIKKTDAFRKVNSFIQNIHHFRDHYLKEQTPPVERVVIFDEAQRAWSQEQTSKFMQQRRGQEGFDKSEPEFLIEVMDRHEGWCVVICLIGGGQEINTGEAGLLEWLDALQGRFTNWSIFASSLLLEDDYVADEKARERLEQPEVEKRPALHLSASMRSFRADNLNAFVSALMDGETDQARKHYAALRAKYPVTLTRDLPTARSWLRAKARGSERFGMIASSGAHRLRPEGLNVRNSITPEYWFLNDRDDVRSSFYLEEVATEFDIQGLELDWSCLAWGADLRWSNNNWSNFSFRGTSWQKVNAQTRQQYQLNAYRVLLTRARQGMIIFVPKGDASDPTRPPNFYNQTYEMLLRVGLPEA